METKIKIGDKVYRVEISELPENLLAVKIGDREYFFNQDELGELISSEGLKEFSKENEVISGGLEQKEIKSPIAGTISAIYVEEGEKVRPGQKVITLISMKMENEIISESFGRVKEIKAKENQFVNTDDVLMVLD